MRVTARVRIAAPPEAVFDFVADMRNDSLWAPLVSEVEQIVGDGPGVGARWRYRQAFGPRSFMTEMEMVQYQRPTLLVWRMENRGMQYESTMMFAPTAGGTMVRQSNVETLRLPWYLRPLAPVLVKRMLKRQLRLLRAALSQA